MDNFDASELIRSHGKAIRKLTLQHTLEMAKMYRDYEDQPIEKMIEHIEKKLVEEELDHNRFDEAHRKNCDECHSAYMDFVAEESLNTQEGED